MTYFNIFCVALNFLFPTPSYQTNHPQQATSCTCNVRVGLKYMYVCTWGHWSEVWVLHQKKVLHLGKMFHKFRAVVYLYVVTCQMSLQFYFISTHTVHFPVKILYKQKGQFWNDIYKKKSLRSIWKLLETNFVPDNSSGLMKWSLASPAELKKRVRTPGLGRKSNFYQQFCDGRPPFGRSRSLVFCGDDRAEEGFLVLNERYQKCLPFNN